MARTCCTKPVTKLVGFTISAPKAKKVSIAGTFNNWDPNKDIAKKDLKGNWTAKITLTSGRYEYKFVIDGVWSNDPSCTNCVTNNFGTQNCVIEVR